MSSRSDRRPAIRELVRETVANAILDAAETVAADKGVEATSIAAIAQRAGVAVGTLYNYFPDKDALLSALYRARREAIHPRIAEVAQQLRGDTVETRLRSYLEQVLIVLEDYRTYCRIAIADDGFARYKGRQRPVVDALHETIAGIVRPVSRDRADEHARMIVASTRGLLRLRLEQGAPFRDDATFVAATFVHGLAMT